MPDIVIMGTSISPNLQVLLEAHQENNLKDGVLKLVVSGDKQALALAQAAGVNALPVETMDSSVSLAQRLKSEFRPDLIVVLDWPVQLNHDFLSKFSQKVIGIRPSLADEFPGAGRDAIKQAFEAYNKGTIKWSGCHVHYVVPNGKTGKVMRQLVVPIESRDTLERFEERMHTNEKWLLLKSVKQFLYELRMRKKRTRRK